MNTQPPAPGDYRPGPHLTGPHATGRYILGQKQIARYLGCSPSTLKRWVRAGRLPISKLGEGRTGKIAISVHALDRWIRKQSRLRRVALQTPPALSTPSGTNRAGKNKMR